MEGSPAVRVPEVSAISAVKAIGNVPTWDISQHLRLASVVRVRKRSTPPLRLWGYHRDLTGLLREVHSASTLAREKPLVELAVLFNPNLLRRRIAVYLVLVQYDTGIDAVRVLENGEMTNRVTSYCKNDTPESKEAGNGFAGVYSTVMVGGILYGLDNLQLLCAARTNGLLAGS